MTLHGHHLEKCSVCGEEPLLGVLAGGWALGCSECGRRLVIPDDGEEERAAVVV